MPRKSRKPQRSLTRSQRKRAALAAAAQSATVAQQPEESATHRRVPAEPTPSRSIDLVRPVSGVRSGQRPAHASRRHRKSIAAVVIAGVALSAGAMASVLLAGKPQQPAGFPSPTIIVGIPGPVVLTEPTPASTPSPEGDPTPRPTTTAMSPPAETPMPTSIPVAPTPPAPQPTAAAPPPPPPAVPAPPTTAPSAEPTTGVVAAATHADEAVAAFYQFVADGDFDAAYGLWSDSMKAAYPREGNLDQRFAGTSLVSFDELRVAERSGNSATVQANFTETYDSGSTRQFIGYWRLVLVNGRWLLDQPNY